MQEVVQRPVSPHNVKIVSFRPPHTVFTLFILFAVLMSNICKAESPINAHPWSISSMTSIGSVPFSSPVTAPITFPGYIHKVRSGADRGYWNNVKSFGR